MNRVPEPEVMEGWDQALAYARADFGAVNQGFVAALAARHPALRGGRVVDLGCGPADIPLRLARALPELTVLGVDASWSMLALGAEATRGAGADSRVRLVCARLPDLPFPPASFHAVVSNSLVHHLPDAGPFWREARRLGRPQAVLHVMDLFRPASVERARAIVEDAAAEADPLLKEDFFNSLLAAFTPAEVRVQLIESGLGHLTCEIISERHWLVSGRL